MSASIGTRGLLLTIAVATIIASSSRLKADTGMCGGASITLPFTDVSTSNVFFCSIAEAFFSGLTNGTGPGIYSPSANVTREQMAAFVTRTMDKSVNRGSRRAALEQFWTNTGASNLALTTVGTNPQHVKSDGADLWVNNFGSGTVSRVRASDGHLIDTWTGATMATSVLVAMGKVFLTANTSPGKLYQIDPALPAGAVTTVTSALGAFSQSIAFDGQRIWTANAGGSVSIVTLDPLTVNTTATGFSSPTAIIFDGANMWVTDFDGNLKKLDSSGNVIATVAVANNPAAPSFDGTNIWVPNYTANSISIVRATGGLSGTVLATLTDNGLSRPSQVAFDGERMLVTNNDPAANSVSLWSASDLTPIGTFSTGPSTQPAGACSDGVNFWITLSVPGKLARF